MNDSKVTSASEFRKMRLYGVGLTLFTGRAIRMRSTDPSQFITDKDFDKTPLMFQQFIISACWEGDYRAKVDEFLKPRTTPQDAKDFVTSLGLVAAKVMIKPVVVDTVTTDDDEEEICRSDLRLEELVWIFRLAFENQKVLYFLEANGLDSGDDAVDQTESDVTSAQ